MVSDCCLVKETCQLEVRNTEFCGAYPCVFWEREEITARKSRGVMRFGAWAMAGKKRGRGMGKRQLRCHELSDFER